MPPLSQRMAQSPDATFMASIKLKAPDEDFTKEQIEVFRKNPELYMKFVKVVEKQVNSKFKMACIIHVQSLTLLFPRELIYY